MRNGESVNAALNCLPKVRDIVSTRQVQGGLHLRKYA
jgi:hypothetical protein